ncbi:LamG-like jellyroll fold domain-containing protein [Zooshikella sp. RANM57]|uniref:LamG domain-containing protein n=1 Tax=Zooshikella sp. RANM57 TaxID=3425863 RepID=UPI003D6E09EB
MINYTKLLYSLCLSTIFFSPVCTSDDITPTSTQLGYWSFDAGLNNEGARDFSGNEHHGYFLSNEYEVSLGKIMLAGGRYSQHAAKGTALLVDMEDPLLINLSDFDVSKPFSLALWFKADEVGMQQTLFEQNRSPEFGEGRFGIYLNEQNQVAIEFVNENGIKGGLISNQLTQIKGKWQHLVFSFDGNQYDMHLALNGQYLPATKTALPSFSKLDGPIIIGNGVNQIPFYGALDEIQLYSRAISSLEAKCLTELGFKCVPDLYQGPTGPKGEQGAVGLQGPQGKQGKPGERGVEGPQGKQGVAGPQGSVGPQGPKGEKGEQGNQGKQGPVGTAGKDGKDGVIKPPVIRTCRFSNPNEYLGICQVSCESNETVIGGGCKVGKELDPGERYYYLKKNYPHNNGWYCEAIANGNFRNPTGSGYAICMETTQDEDSMQDSWERYYGLDPDADDAQQDADNDGITNAQEYINGTNPVIADASTVALNKKIQQLKPIRHYVADDINGEKLRDRSGTVDGQFTSRSGKILDKVKESEVPGVATKSFDFDGDAYLSMGGLSTEDMENGFTWVGWFRLDSLQYYQRMFYAVNSVNDGIILDFYKKTNMIRTPIVLHQTDLKADQYYFIGLSYYNSQFTLFLNGNVSKVFKGVPSLNNKNFFYLGYSIVPSEGVPGSGGISDLQFQRVAVFNKCLSQQEIAELYQLGSTQ